MLRPTGFSIMTWAPVSAAAVAMTHTVRFQDAYSYSRFVDESRKNRLSDLPTLERWHQRDTSPVGMGSRTVVPHG
jgi:hypothetical protein